MTIQSNIRSRHIRLSAANSPALSRRGQGGASFCEGKHNGRRLNHPPTRSTPRRIDDLKGGGGGDRRGNTLVLVAAVLALLAIIATAYMTRTQSQRAVSVAQQSAAMRSETADLIAETLAEEVAGALFVRPVDPMDQSIWDSAGLPTLPANPNFPRKLPSNNATRYGVDQQWIDTNNNGVNEFYTFGYNKAPYHTVPVTNWPMPQTVAQLAGLPINLNNSEYADVVRLLPAGPGNPFDPSVPDVIPGSLNPILSFESNEMGNPGFGDARWLADTEPVRWTLSNGYEAFSHWRKLTNVARPNNSWRVVADISNVEQSIVNDLTIPVEQWPAVARPNMAVQHNLTGDTSIQFLNQISPSSPYRYLIQWANWLGFEFDTAANTVLQPQSQAPIFGYLSAYGASGTSSSIAPFGMPSNYVRLSNLTALPDNQHSWTVNVNGVPVFQDRPESEFIPGTARHTVSRVLTDTTGDGYTDAFWFDPGMPPKDGVRQIVAVRIEDNSSRLNANVASRFHRNEADGPLNDTPYRTRGHTPVDLALVGQLETLPASLQADDLPVDHFNIGLYDNPENWFSWFGNQFLPNIQQYRNPGSTTSEDLWWRHANAIGMVDNNGDPNLWPSTADRLDFWQFSGRHGVGYSYNSPYRPFSLADDLELRMFHGNNFSWALTDYERTTQPLPNENPGFLRASMHDNYEQSEYSHQLNNRNLVRDNRRKLTLYSGARNDQLPPWLWWENRHAPGWLTDVDSVSNVCLLVATEPDFAITLPAPIRNRLLSLCGGGFTTPDVAALANGIFRRFVAQSRQKLDLREYEDRYYRYYTETPPPGTGDDLSAPTVDAFPQYYMQNRDAGRLNLRDRLATTLMMALTDGPYILEPDRVYTSYYGDYIVPDEFGLVGQPLLQFSDTDDRRHFLNEDGNLNNTRRLAAAYAANILAYGNSEPVRLDDRVLLPAYGARFTTPQLDVIEPVYEQSKIEPGPNPGGNDIGYVALDYQPFLVEAMIAHVHGAVELQQPHGPLLPGDRVFCRPNNATIVLVEIANPFDVPISLEDFRISVYEEPVRLQGVLPPHQSRLYYSIPADPALDDISDPITLNPDNWLEYFGFDGFDDNAIVDVINLDGSWPLTRQEFDAELRERAIEIERLDPDLTDTWYVVDRIDRTSAGDVKFGDQLRDMNVPGTTWYQTSAVMPTCTPGPEWPTVPLLAESAYAMQWVRVARAWQMEPVLDSGSELNQEDPDYYVPPHERNPRYVFALRQVQVQNRPVGGSAQREIITDDEEQFIWHEAVLFDEAELLDEEFEPDWGLFPEPRFAKRMKLYETTDPNATTGYSVFDGDGRLFFPMRMNLKKMPPNFDVFTDFADGFRNPGFEQIGELLNVWAFGHELEFDDSTGDYVSTRTTFAEFMADKELNGLFDWTEPVDSADPDGPQQIADCWRKLRDGELSIVDAENEDEEAVIRQCIAWLTQGDAHLTNRLRTRPREMPEKESGGMRRLSAVLNRPLTPNEMEDEGLVAFVSDELWQNYRLDERHRWPALPAGAIVLDAFVCDGPGAVWWDDSANVWRDSLGDALAGIIPGDLTGFEEVQRRRLYNANGFNGSLTPGLINVNTATPEVLRTLPHMTRLVHETWSVDENPWSRLPWAIQRYRERLGAPVPNGDGDLGPAYGHRGRSLKDPNETLYYFDPNNTSDLIAGFVPGMRGERGMASLGELTFLNQSGRALANGNQKSFNSDTGRFEYPSSQNIPGPMDSVLHWNSNWRIDSPAMFERTTYLTDLQSDILASDYESLHPQTYVFADPVDTGGENPGQLSSDEDPPQWIESLPRSTRLSTDVQDRTGYAFDAAVNDGVLPPDAVWPEVAEDAREANLLFAGMSNIVSTRSDVFTVYFRIRSFRQNPTTGVWDATDREHIIDDTRYVMLVDRSEVNRPTDKPKILYLEKLPH